MQHEGITETKHLILGWDEVERLTRVLADRVTIWTRVEPKAIIAVSRGGLIPAVMLSHLWNIRDFYTVSCRSYDKDHKQGSLDVEVSLKAKELLQRPTTLIVDDIIDTGSTMEVLKAQFPRPLRGVLITKIERDPTTIFAERSPKGVWVEFPWENEYV